MQGGITIVIPGAPAAKGRPRIGLACGRPVAYTPAKTRTREGVVASLAVDAMAGRAPLTGPLRVVIAAIMPVAPSWPKKRQAAALAGEVAPTGRPDLDNILKLVADGMNGIVWGDDSQIVMISARKLYGTPARTIVTVGAAP